MLMLVLQVWVVRSSLSCSSMISGSQTGSCAESSQQTPEGAAFLDL